MWNNLQKPRGFLFIGDPHVSSVVPGRRIDDYLTTVLGKLSQAADICRERQLIPIILGDLIHRDNESNIALVYRLAAVLKSFPYQPIELGGNHGKKQFEPSKDDVELLLADVIGAIRLVSKPGLIAVFHFDEFKVALHACNHGAPLPTMLPRIDDNTINVLITHADLAFEGAYPGATIITEITNCDMLVNGHMHKTTKSIQAGTMLAHNPGNIEPLSLDVADHEPSVWEWSPEQLDLTLIQHKLAHDANCFDLTGVRVAAAEDTLSAVESLKESQFAKLLAGESSLDAQRTADGSVLLEDLTVVCETAGASPAAKSLLESLISTLPTA